MNREIALPYGHQTRTISVPESNLAWVAGPKDVPPLADLSVAITWAIRKPIGSPSIAELAARHGKRTLILVDDGTRNTPQKLILPILLEQLNSAGVADSDVSVVFALGTHRAMSPAEIVERLGEQMCRRVRVLNLPQKPEDFIDLGVTPLGIPIQVSRLLLESDLSIAVGNIIPHMYAGWAGGAKMVQPGVTSKLTTGRTHLIAGPRVYEILGDVENEVRREMEQIAIRCGLKFILNVVLNASAQVVAVVAGDVVKAHRAGVEVARPIYTLDVDEQPDIVIASSHPADRDLWQGFKPINNCGMLAKDGGTLILLIPAPEGVAPDHPQFLEFGSRPGADVMKMVEAGEVANEVAAATYMAFDRTRRRLNIILVSDGVTNDDAVKIGIAATTRFDDALAVALHRHGASARIGVVTQGADVMARFSKAAETGGPS